MRLRITTQDASKDHYTVVVVGSGYIGGIAASRMARTGRAVCALEHGKEQNSSTPGANMPTANYLPDAKRAPNSVGLSLSGGGYRATLFHLGAVRRLNELGILPKITTLFSVSGGSILNAFLASRLSRAVTAGIPNFENAAAKPVRDFCSLNIRRWLALEAVIPGTHNTIGLAKKYDQHLTNGKLLAQIPDSPVHVFVLPT